MKLYRVEYTEEACGDWIVMEVHADSKAEAVMDVVNNESVYSIIGVERVKE
jgi:hypothetical protein